MLTQAASGNVNLIFVTGSAKKGLYSLSNCMYLAIDNLTCEYGTYQPEIWSLYTPNIALFLDVILR